MKNYNKITKLSFTGHGHYKVTVERYGKEISATTTDMPTIDAYKSEEKGWKKAGNRLYDFVVEKNRF